MLKAGSADDTSVLAGYELSYDNLELFYFGLLSCNHRCFTLVSSIRLWILLAYLITRIHPEYFYFQI